MTTWDGKAFGSQEACTEVSGGSEAKGLISGFPSLAFWHDLIAHVSNTCAGTTIETHIPAPVSFKQMGEGTVLAPELSVAPLGRASTRSFNPSL